MIFGASSPEIVHVEITEACNFRCRHCYNFYRGESYKPKEISWENLNNTIRELVENNVRHVIITGGEPLLALKKTCHLAMQADRWGITNSLNSNLGLATLEIAKKLKDSDVQHCLTTLNASTDKLTSWITCVPDALDKISRGIKNMQEAGIRVTANLILNQYNKDDVMDTALHAYDLGLGKFLANRCIPSAGSDYIVSKEDARKMFDDLLKISKLMEVQTCRMVPECFFDDLEKYKPFINRGCSAGKKHLLLNVNGEAHACVHEDKSYGNIHEIGIKGVWENMKSWRTDEYLPKECLDCERLMSCKGGCRMVALAHTGRINGTDNLSRYSC